MPLYGPMFIPSLMVTPSVLLELTKQENGSNKKMGQNYFLYLSLTRFIRFISSYL